MATRPRESGLHQRPAKETGWPPYDPGDLLRLYLYGYFCNCFSKRMLVKVSFGAVLPIHRARRSARRQLEESIAIRWREAMLRGDFEAAWRETDRLELPRRESMKRGAFVRTPSHLLWDGTPLDGRTVLIRCEHGLGDTIMFMRYAPLVRARAVKVIASVQLAVLPLFRGAAGIDGLLNGCATDALPPHEIAIECMELAYAFRSTITTLPAAVPYLPVDRLRAAASRFTDSALSARKVALVWAASPWDPRRSISLAELAPLAALRDVSFYSLQQGPEAIEATDAPFPIESLSHRTADIADAAAAMLEMDLIITVDNMVAHLAGALGRPVWVLLKAEADWRWMRKRPDSPWYPTMRLFRQRRAGDWREPVQEILATLRNDASKQSRFRSL